MGLGLAKPLDVEVATIGGGRSGAAASSRTGAPQELMRSIIRASLQFRLLVVAAAVAVIALGVAGIDDARVDVLPEFTPTYVEIQTEALGLSAEEVEQLVTVPLEADLLNGVAGVETIRSESVPGLSSIVMVFDPDTEVFQARQLVQERLTQVGAAAFPNVSRPPTMIQPLSSSSRVMMIGLDPDRLSAIDASVIARWTMRPRLTGVPGVANVSIWGQRDRQLQVQVDPERLRERRVTLSQVIRTTGNAQLVSPLSFLEASTPGTGGFVETPTQRLQVRQEFEKLSSPGALARVPVEGTDGGMRLGDVARVAEDHQPLIGDALVSGRGGLQLVIEKFPGASTVEVTEGVEEALEELQPGLSGMRIDPNVFRPATFIEEAMGNLVLALAIGAALLALAFAAFLFEWRAALVSLVAIPLSLLAALLVLGRVGVPLSAIALAGLAAATAVVVDDAVVGASAARGLRRRRPEAGEGADSSAVLEASAGVRGPLVYATLIVALAIVPVLALGGRPGDFFSPLAIAYLLAILASMVVAVTVTPALSLLLLSRRGGEPRPSPLTAWLAPRYGGVLSRILRAPRAALVAAAACVVLALAATPLLSTSLVPSFKDREVLVRLDAPRGTSQPRMSEITAQAAGQLRSISGVADVGAHVGRAVTGDATVDVDSSELWVSLVADADADYDTTLASIEGAVDGLRGVKGDVGTYSSQRTRDIAALDDGERGGAENGLEMLTGADKPLAVRVYGQDTATLRRMAEEVRGMLAGLEGVVAPRVEAAPTKPVVEIEVDLAKARRFGIKPGDVRRAEATLLQGIQVGSIFQGQKVFEVIVQGMPDARRSVASVRNLLIDRPGGGHVRLGEVADVRVRPAPTVVRRDAVSRRVDVEAGVSGRSAGAVRREVADRLARMSFPLEYHAEVQPSSGREAQLGRVLALALAAALGAFLLLQAALRSWRLAALVLFTLPVALAGGVLATLIASAELSLGSLLGLLALLGIGVRNSILLIRGLQVGHAGGRFALEAVKRAADERFAPLVASTVALAVLFLPFVILGDIPGLEVIHPLAVVVLGGLVTSLALSALVLPALLLRFGRWEPPAEPHDDEVERSAERGPASGARPASGEPVPAGAGRRTSAEPEPA